MKVLVVDGDRDLWDRLLELMPAQRRPALSYTGSPAAARTWLQSGHADLVVLELRLPDDGGLDLLRTLRREHPQLRVVVFSNHPELRGRTLALGACCFIDKSLEFPSLLELLDAGALSSCCS